MRDVSLTRRALLATLVTTLGSCAAALAFGRPARGRSTYDRVDAFIREALQTDDTPGIAACVVRGDRIEWSAGYGRADMRTGRPMSPNTVQNIASVSKTITATAIMQLREEGRIDLDADVNVYLPFPVRNPRYPAVRITTRQLLTHSSSITDGPAYEPSYGCGDPAMALIDWLQAYFDPAGANYDAEGNFLSWRPGTLDIPPDSDGYSNLGFGLLGGLVEILTGVPFAEYCHQRILAPLSMSSTGWYLTDVDRTNHAIPYGSRPDPRLSASPGRDGGSSDSRYHPYCLYSFTNYPDGLLRTSVDDLSRFLRAYIGAGTFGSTRILEESTVRKMLAVSHDGQGLCWRLARHSTNGDAVWGHGGGDPGVSTAVGFRPRDKVGVIVFSNYDGWELVPEVSRALFEATAV